MTVSCKNRQKPFRVYVADQDRDEIMHRARQAGLSVSEYLRIVGMNGQIRSTYDHEAVIQLSRVNGDLGRLGGLLKIWLMDRGGDGASTVELRRLYNETKYLQQQILTLMARV
jgi:hypothetical protein